MKIAQRGAAAAAMGALAVLLTTGCSLSVGDAHKKDEPTTATPTSAAEESPVADEPTDAAPSPEASSPPADTGVTGSGAVHKDRVEQTISDKIAARTGKRPSQVVCPTHLPARVGATIRCRITADGQETGVTVTTVSVNGKQVNFSVEADDATG